MLCSDEIFLSDEFTVSVVKFRSVRLIDRQTKKTDPCSTENYCLYYYNSGEVCVLVYQLKATEWEETHTFRA